MTNEIKIVSRKELYKEIWETSVKKTAEKYGIPYSQMKKICAQNDIPTPGSGFATRREFGQDVTKYMTPLPESKNDKIKIEVSPMQKDILVEDIESVDKNDENKVKVVKPNMLSFLDEEYRDKVILEIESIKISNKGSMNYQIREYKEALEKCSRSIKNNEYRYRRNSDYPLFYKEVSPEGLKRVVSILNALAKSMERLGGGIDNYLRFSIGKDFVYLGFLERRDKVQHQLTKEEAKQLVKYEDDKKRYSWASKPQIRKWDHPYTGVIRMDLGHRLFIDKDDDRIENHLGEMLIAIFEAIESAKQERLKEEELQRIAEEKARIEREQREEEIRVAKEKQHLYETEIIKTKELIMESEDYRKAELIRNYVSKVASNTRWDDKEGHAWVEWARARADWYDPTVAARDPVLGWRRESTLMQKYKNSHIDNLNDNDE